MMRLLASLALAVASAVSLTACAHTPASEPVSQEMDMLTSSVNHLTYPPYLRGEPAPAPDQAYDARTATLLGVGRPAAVSKSTRTELVRDARQFGPITGRWLLRALGDDFASWTGDLGAVQAFGRRDGSYAEPGTTARAAVAETTERVVELATSSGDTALTKRLRGRTSRWLSDAACSHRLEVAAPAAEALRLLHRPPAVAETSAPDSTGFPTLSGGQRRHLLDRTYDYVRLRQASAQRVDIDTELWLHVLNTNISTLSAQSVYELTVILRGAGVSARQLSAVAGRLGTDRLPDGLYRDPSSYAGDLSTTVYALALRHQAGESMVDANLSAGVAEAEKNRANRSDRDSTFVIDSLSALSDARRAGPAVTDVCGQAATVRIDDVPSWAFVAMTCRLVGATLATSSFLRWPTDNAHGLVEAAWVVVSLGDVGRLTDVPGWIRRAIPARPRLSAVRPARLGGLANAAAVLAAISDVHGTVARAVVHAVSRRAAASRGCPGFPDLYRAVPGDPFSCDLATTLAVLRYLDPEVKEGRSDE